MRFLIIIGLIASLNANCTNQYPDLLIVGKDTLYIDFFPLDDYLENTKINISDYGVWVCWSTGCWRGYQATWELIDNELFLTAIHSCCDGDSYHTFSDSTKDIIIARGVPKEILLKLNLGIGLYTRKDLENKLERINSDSINKKFCDVIINNSRTSRPQANLEAIFGEKYTNGHVFAYWYNEDVVESTDTFIRSKDSLSQKPSGELIIRFESGVLIDSIYYNNSFIEVDPNFKILYGKNYVYVAPTTLKTPENPLESKLSNSLRYSNKDKTLKIKSKFKSFDTWLTTKNQTVIIESTLKDYSSKIIVPYKFEPISIMKTRYGIIGWINGYNIKTKTQIRIATAINRYNQVILVYSAKNKKQESFNLDADYITNSIRISEFFLNSPNP